jgi:hypothetical protein
METATTIPQPLAVPALAAMPRPATAEGPPPWQDESPARAADLRLRRPAPASRLGEALHWGVVALTLFTAFSVLLGAFGGHTRPRELLPIMIISAG